MVRMAAVSSREGWWNTLLWDTSWRKELFSGVESLSMLGAHQDEMAFPIPGDISVICVAFKSRWKEQSCCGHRRGGMAFSFLTRRIMVSMLLSRSTGFHSLHHLLLWRHLILRKI